MIENPPKLKVGMQFETVDSEKSVALVTGIIDDHRYTIAWINGGYAARRLSSWDTTRNPPIRILIHSVEDGEVIYA